MNNNNINRIRIKARVIYSSRKESDSEIEIESNENIKNDIIDTAISSSRELKEIEQQTQSYHHHHKIPIEEEPEYSTREDNNDNGVDQFGKTGKVLLKPVFVPKSSRQEQEAEARENNDWEKEEEYRKSVAKEMFLDFMQRDVTTRNAKLKTETEVATGAFDPRSIDDTDNIDELAERQEWELRELLRIKREKESREQWELQKIEQERIRNTTEEEKQRIDKEKEAEWMSQPKSQYKFLQKYYHKGAFFMDSKDPILQRDYSQATGDDRTNKELLPETKQKKNFGKKSQSKWTHLTNEDTTCFDYGWGWKKNEINYKTISKMSGMKSDLDNPSKKYKN